MTGIRRYDEQETAEILRRATETHEPAPPSAGAGSRLTLSEIQGIGSEVGIEPSRIERAAQALEVPAQQQVTFLGAPRSVSRIVPIDRPMDDDEWVRLVVLLRETFGARGEVETLGPLRTWHNGNLQVHVEPWEDGYRVRMHTLKGGIEELSAAALAMTTVAVIMFVMIILKRGIDPALMIAALFATWGLGMIGGPRLKLPGWAAERATQMDEIAAKIQGLLEEQGQ